MPSPCAGGSSSAQVLRSVAFLHRHRYFFKLPNQAIGAHINLDKDLSCNAVDEQTVSCVTCLWGGAGGGGGGLNGPETGRLLIT